jgi:hypothetical protein
MYVFELVLGKIVTTHLSHIYYKFILDHSPSHFFLTNHVMRYD